MHSTRVGGHSLLSTRTRNERERERQGVRERPGVR